MKESLMIVYLKMLNEDLLDMCVCACIARGMMSLLLLLY